MPNYDYSCTTCGHQEEIMQKMCDQALKACSKCHAKTFKRHIGGGIGLQFKGSGFYQTDYTPTQAPCCPCSNQSGT